MDELTIKNSTLFRNIAGEEFTLAGTADRILNYINADTNHHYEIAIGTDSQTYDDTKFALAIVVHRMNAGAIFFFKTMHHRKLGKNQISEKLYKETQVSLDTAEILLKELLDKGFDIAREDVRLVIHVDVGPNGKTNVLIPELTGWVHSAGYDVEIKPDSYAASSVADRFSK